MTQVDTRLGGRLVGSRGGQLVNDCGGIRVFLVTMLQRGEESQSWMCFCC